VSTNIEIGIGSKIWIFDANVRVYKPYEPGKGISSPIWRHHWVEREIVGETSKSWIYNYFREVKIPKNRTDFRTLAYSEQEIDDLEWAHEHKLRIADQIKYKPLPIEQLKEVARIIGYEAKQGQP
jgi:hypothetical protein